MDKEKQIEEMAELIDTIIDLYGSNPYPPDEDLSVCIASDLVLRGYGNVKQAVKEFYNLVKETMDKCKVERTFNERVFLAQTEMHCKVLIELDKKIKELYGEE